MGKGEEKLQFYLDLQGRVVKEGGSFWHYREQLGWLAGCIPPPDNAEFEKECSLPLHQDNSCIERTSWCPEHLGDRRKLCSRDHSWSLLSSDVVLGSLYFKITHTKVHHIILTEMKTKSILKYHFSLSRLAKIKLLITHCVDQSTGQWDLFSWREAEMVQLYRGHLAVATKMWNKYCELEIPLLGG